MHPLIAVAIILDLLVLVAWLAVEPLAGGVWGSPLAPGAALFSAWVLWRVSRELRLSRRMRVFWGGLLVAAYPLALGVLAVEFHWAGVRPEIGGAALCAVLMFPLAQIAGLVLFNAWRRGRAPVAAGTGGHCAA
jgi:hypothetical protein